ncbi:hypothetical protein Tco_1253542 [Tanacetum coccineum]
MISTYQQSTQDFVQSKEPSHYSGWQGYSAECARTADSGLCRGEGHMARQCTQPKRPRNSEWFNEKMQLAQAQEAGTDDLDAFDSDCDEALSASAVLMAKLFAFDSDYSEQPVFVDGSTIDITSDSYLKENKSEVVQDTNSSEQQDAIIMSVIEEMSNQVTKCNAVNQEHKTVNESLTAELE